MNMLARHARLVMGLLLLLSAAAPGAALNAASDISPQDLVRDTSTRMLSALRDEHASIEQNAERLYEMVDAIVLPYFDFERMSQWVLGPNWRTATPEQRSAFVEQFRNLLVRTYSRALKDYADEKITYLPFVNEGNSDLVTVRTEIEHAGSAIPIAYSMYRSALGWKVYDVSVSGVSLVTNYRSTFGNIIRKEGMDSLIRQLAERNSSRSDG